jgi:ABC-type branched-subunit amino acid transport system substrate-binding protein
MTAVPRRRRTAVPLLVVGALALTACGTQVDAGVRRTLAQAQLGGSSAAGPGTASAAAPAAEGAGPATTPLDPGTAAGPASAAGPSAAPAAAQGAGRTAAQVQGPAAAATLPPGGNGGATDVGVTATTITLGHVSDLSGPQPGLFQTAVNGTNAYLAYVNSTGGLFGRQLKISVADAQTSCEGDRSGHAGLIGRVFAFAGSFSLFDSCGATVLKANPGVPDAHLAVTPDANALPNNFSVNPIGTTIGNGVYAWGTQKFGADAVKHAAFMYVNLPAVTNVAGLQKRAAESTGWSFGYERAIGATETDFTADIIQMKQKGIKVFLTLFNADEMANFKPQADQQGFAPTIMAPLMYDQTFFKKLGGSAAAEGIYGSTGSALFFSAADIRNVPTVALFQKWYSRVSGGAAADTFAADAWAETALLVEAMRRAGPRLTRAGVLAELRKIHTFDADGFFAPADPAGKKGSGCYVIFVIRSGEFQRIDSPVKGYRCDGRQV